MKLFLPATLAFFVFVASVSFSQVHAATYTVSPSDNLTQKASTLQPGDTMILSNGTYNQPLRVLNSGTTSQPISIKAATDGGAIIDGTTTNQWNDTVHIQADNIILEGITARKSTRHVYELFGDNITARRVTGYNANPNGNFHIFVATGNNIVIEDAAAAGTGRYLFLAHESNAITFRRCFAYWTGTNFTNAPRSAYGIYGSSNVTIENSIGTHVVPNNNSLEQYAGVYITRNDATTQKDPINPIIRGSIFYNIFEFGVMANVEQITNLQIKNSAFVNVKDSPCTFSALCPKNSSGINTYESQNSTITDSTFVGNKHGIWTYQSGVTLKNLSFVKNDWAHRGVNPTHSYLNFWQNNILSLSSALLLGTADKQLNPGYNESTYGLGAYLFTPSNSPLKNAGENGADIGANILYQYGSSGTLTSTPLWPWPLEDRIQTETTRELGKTISPTWADHEGLWKTLTGVYSGTQPTTQPTTIPSQQPTQRPTNTPSIKPTNTLTPRPTEVGNPASVCESDINQSGLVDLTDYTIMIQDFFKSNPTNSRSDIDKNGFVDLTDYSLLARDFFQTCPN